MAEEGTELSGLPPRKRFKVMEQQRRRRAEGEESSPELHSPCKDVTNVAMASSQGFLVLEKQKYKLQQQENRVPETLLPPLPPRPVAVKRKEFAPALPLSAPPTIRLKFQGEKVHSRAFKVWGSPSPKQGSIPLEAPGSKHGLKDSGSRLKRHQEHAKAWAMAKGTTCSINKAQEDDVEMMVCEPVPVLYVSTTSSDPDLVSEPGNNEVASDYHMVGAAPKEDVKHVEEQENESNVAAAGIVTANIGCFVADVADVSHSSPTDVDAVLESDEGKRLLQVRDSEEPIEHPTSATVAVPEAFSSQFSDPLAPIVSDTSAETSNISEELTVSAKTLLNPSDGKICSAGQHEEPATQVVIDAVVCLENKERVVADTQETGTKQDRLLAEIDERAEIHLFNRMFEREGSEGCEVEQDSIADSLSKFFLAFSGVNDVDSMEVGGGSTLKSQDSEDAVPVSVKSSEIDLGRPTVNVLEEGHNMPLISEVPESTQAHEGSVCSEDQEIDIGSSRLKAEEADCKSSKEDSSDWDLEMEIPSFSFGKRSGMTQRVKAPGQWLQIDDSANVENEAEEDEDEDDDGGCDICRNPDADPSDPIVYCDGCDVPVHADCYGNPLSHGVPEGDWFCAQCQHRNPNSRGCCLCPRSGGAMKMTTDGNWAHLSCAVFVPEVFFRKADDLEEIDTSHVPSKRWLSTCCVCKSDGGACIDCTEIGCKASFHVSCALKKDLALEFRNGRHGNIVISFCPEHTAAWDEQQEARKAGRSKYKIVSREQPQKAKASERLQTTKFNLSAYFFPDLAEAASHSLPKWSRGLRRWEGFIEQLPFLPSPIQYAKVGGAEL